MLVEGEYVIGEYKIVISPRDKDVFIYTRTYMPRKETILSKVVVGLERTLVIPMYPVLVPKKITNYVLIDFEKSVEIAPFSQTHIVIQVPVDIAIYVYKKNEFSILDVFPVARTKYTLYGHPNEGVIARYSVSRVYFEEPEPQIGYSVAHLIIRNKTKEWVEVSKVLLDSHILRLYYITGTWSSYVQDIIMTIISRSTAIITYGDIRVRNVVAIDDPPDLKPPRILPKTEMLWGI